MPSTGKITGSMLHDLVACERRVHHDLHTDLTSRDPVSEFVQMLWRGGRTHEDSVLAEVEGRIVDLRGLSAVERMARTQQAMNSECDVILGSCLEHEDLLGMPDLLRREPGGWVSGDVKSGSAFEANGTTPRRGYAAQVSLYALILERTGFGRGDRAFVIGRTGTTTHYDLTAPRGRGGQSIAETTSRLIDQARAIRDGLGQSRGALAAQCKMCHWHTLCEGELAQAQDLSLIAGLGRSGRDALAPLAPTLPDLAALDVVKLSANRKAAIVPGIGAERLRRFVARARLMVHQGPAHALRPLNLRRNERELHLDLETDPSRDGLTYLHGILDRRLDGPTQYISYFADREEDEEAMFAASLELLMADPHATIYYYSKFERSTYRALQRRYPRVCSEGQIEQLFEPTRSIDLLFDVIMPHTEWPTRNLSIKTIARHCGFDWRDTHASGANSISWYDDYRRGEDPKIKQRILDYNEDDVLASAAVLDGLISLPVLPEGWHPPIEAAPSERHPAQ